MEQQVIVLNGIIYDYFEEVKFYKMIGFLDSKTGMMEGIELVSDTYKTLNQVKETIYKLTPISATVTVGFMNQEIGYYSLNMTSAVVGYTGFKLPLDSKYSGGHEQKEGLFTEKKTTSRFKTLSSLEYCDDKELRVLLQNILGPQTENFVWSKLKEDIAKKRETGKVKILSA